MLVKTCQIQVKYIAFSIPLSTEKYSGIRRPAQPSKVNITKNSCQPTSHPIMSIYTEKGDLHVSQESKNPIKFSEYFSSLIFSGVSIILIQFTDTHIRTQVLGNMNKPGSDLLRRETCVSDMSDCQTNWAQPWQAQCKLGLAELLVISYHFQCCNLSKRIHVDKNPDLLRTYFFV